MAQRLRPAVEVARPPRTPRERAGRGRRRCSAWRVFLGAAAGGRWWSARWRGPHGYGLGAYDGAAVELADGRRVVHRPPTRSPTRSPSPASTLVLAGALGLLAALVVGYRRGWLPRTFDALVMLPLGTSAVTVGFGFLVALDQPPLDLRSSVLLIPIAHSLDRAAVRGACRGAGDPLHRPAAARGGSGARRLAPAGLARGGRARSSPGPRSWGRRSRSRSRWVSSARPCSSRGRTRPRCPVAIYRLLSRPGTLAFAPGDGADARS